MRPKHLTGSINRAIKGIVECLKTQRNMRLHFLVAAGVLALSLAIQLNAQEFTLVCLTITLVLVAEMANTALEGVVDMMTNTYHPLARRVKDISAGIVLLTAINACIVGYLVILRRLMPSVGDWAGWVLEWPWHVSLAAAILVLIAVISVKGLFHKGSPMRGGMPSGHAAVAFSGWVICSLVSLNGLVSLVTFSLAGLVALSRVRKKIHTAWEVVAGAFLGIIITVFIFQIFR
ncbi:MAG: diacylglycerol kinase [Candidatus Omnitrophica bacterium]|nr:diacylglycerol kinase [Candidatus Omnitrophota bacterium]